MGPSALGKGPSDLAHRWKMTTMCSASPFLGRPLFPTPWRCSLLSGSVPRALRPSPPGRPPALFFCFPLPPQWTGRGRDRQPRRGEGQPPGGRGSPLGPSRGALGSCRFPAWAEAGGRRGRPPPPVEIQSARRGFGETRELWVGGKKTGRRSSLCQLGEGRRPRPPFDLPSPAEAEAGRAPGPLPRRGPSRGGAPPAAGPLPRRGPSRGGAPPAAGPLPRRGPSRGGAPPAAGPLPRRGRGRLSPERGRGPELRAQRPPSGAPRSRPGDMLLAGRRLLPALSRAPAAAAAAVQILCVRPTRNRRYHHQSRFYSILVPSDEVIINYRYGLPLITLTLPSRQERCRFTIKPMLTTVGSFLQDIRNEDRGIKTAAVFTPDGNSIPVSTPMESLLMNDFKLMINDITYDVQCPNKEKLNSEHMTDLDDIKSLVQRLFTALHVEEHQVKKERSLLEKIEELKEQLQPMEELKTKIAVGSEAKTNRLLWIGLALMSTQGGILAWLTWWVYSWDIMEPVTYFITFGSSMTFFAYFLLTRQDYSYVLIKERQFLYFFHKRLKKMDFDVEQYNKLKEDLKEAEESLQRLRQPLHLQLPIEEIKQKN
ncbi:calcium uniporter regulatory subunit MCUb, mitochondrial isoform 2-T2 [Sarcophilus harrisii]